jgi:Tol biopolymer transport system component
MPLTPGTRIGAYEILEPIGAGGMGEVYRGRDTRLQRDVAIKVVPDLFARDPERLARFEREARTLAALNHPHIAHVYGVEGAALVMEYVDGEDLAQRLARSGPIPMDEALAIALQIADALEAAHEQNIVHRDLKPANIKVRADGAVKVLDFGLAKALAPAAAAAGHDATNSPTITSPFQMSQVGIILGTAAYMAPEQAKGKPADKRADIWAFGCVLFEMLTGTRAFPGEDVTDTLAAIVRAEPEWAALPPETPRAIRTLLRRCLEKDRRERLPDIGAARLELKDASAPGIATEGTAAPSRPSRPLVFLPWALCAVATIAALALAWYALKARPAADTRVYKSLIMPPGLLVDAPALRMQLSPDGRMLAFVATDDSGRGGLWVRPLHETLAQLMADTERATSPFWSPDSQSIGFLADGKLKTIKATGGMVSTLCDAREGPPGTWNRDNVIVFGGRGALLKVPAGGGPPVEVTRLHDEIGERIQISPFFLPDGRHFLYSAGNGASPANSIYLGSLDTKESTLLLEGTSARYAGGYILFMRGSTLTARRFDPDRLTLSGEAMPIAEDVQINRSVGTGAFSASDSGVLVYQTGPSVGTRLTWVDRTGKHLENVGDPGTYRDVRISPDEKWASATIVGASGRPDVYLFDLARHLARRFTFDAAGSFSAVWSAKGDMLAYASPRQKAGDLFQQPVGGGQETVLRQDETDKIPLAFSPDGELLLYGSPKGAVRSAFWLLPLTGSRKPYPFLASVQTRLLAAFSPNGRWLAYASDDAFRPDIYVVSFPDGRHRRQVSTQGGESPAWRADGKELFFTNVSRLMAVDVDTSGTQFDMADVHPLFDIRVPGTGLGTRSTYAVAGNGQRFLVNTWDQRSAMAPITLVVNWPATLGR